MTAATEIIRRLYDRIEAGDLSALDELVAEDMVNHAAGPQGREGLRAILQNIEADLGPTSGELHHLFGEGELVSHHLTIVGTHRGSSMPLLQGIPVSGRSVRWTFMHLWRVVDGMAVEHWACRDDNGLVEQLQSSG